MGKPDVNLYSFTGDTEGNIWLNGLILFWDRDWTPGNVRVYTLNLRGLVLPAGISDTVKFSGVIDLRVMIIGVVPGGKEDCIDINNECRNLTIYAADGLLPGGRYAITCKGGSRDIFIVTVLLGHGKATDVALGEHSDQSNAVTREVTLDIQTRTGRAVDYWQFNANRPIMKEGSGPYNREIKIPGWFRQTFRRVYAFLKRFLPI